MKQLSFEEFIKTLPPVFQLFLEKGGDQLPIQTGSAIAACFLDECTFCNSLLIHYRKIGVVEYKKTDNSKNLIEIQDTVLRYLMYSVSGQWFDLNKGKETTWDDYLQETKAEYGLMGRKVDLYFKTVPEKTDYWQCRKQRQFYPVNPRHDKAWNLMSQAQLELEAMQQKEELHQSAILNSSSRRSLGRL